jgi:hypothetical protein
MAWDTVVSLFAGVGGFEVGLEDVGFRTVEGSALGPATSGPVGALRTPFRAAETTRPQHLHHVAEP